MTRLIPLVAWHKWSTDGLHSGDADMSYASGYSIELAWLGLHFEVVFALERRA